MLLGLRFGADSCTLALSSSTVGGAVAEVIANEDGDRVIPSYIAFLGEDVSIGNIARSQLVRNAKNTIPAFMELLGLPFAHPVVARHCRQYTVEIIEEHTMPHYRVMRGDDQCTLSVEDVCALFIESLVRTAESVCGTKLDRMAITVPAHFEKAQREALLRAARKDSGVKEVVLVPEPAAIIAGYADVLPAVANAQDPASASALSEDRNLLIVDIGGRSTEVTCVALRSGVAAVVAEERDAHLGGRNLDEVLSKHFAQEFYRKTRLDVFENKRSAAKLLLACEQTKKTLSQSQSAPIQIESLHEGVDFTGTINRTRFEMLCGDFAQSLRTLLRKAFADTTWTADQVDEVLLVGGCSRIPCLQAVVANVIPHYMSKRHQQVDPHEVAAIGAVREAMTRREHGQSVADVDDHHVECERGPAMSASIGYILANADGDAPAGTFRPLLQKFHPLPAERTFIVEETGDATTASVLAIVEESNVDKVLASVAVEGGAGMMVRIAVSVVGEMIVSVVTKEE